MSDVFAILYTDKGPRGICGQSMDITCEWSKVFIFSSEDEMRQWLLDNKDITNKGRKKPTITPLYPKGHPCNNIGCSVEIIESGA